MSPPLIIDRNVCLEVKHADLSGSRFVDVNLSAAQFEDINLTGVRVRNVNMSGMAITDANLAGMTIEGMPVTEMIALWQANRKGAGNAKA